MPALRRAFLPAIKPTKLAAVNAAICSPNFAAVVSAHAPALIKTFMSAQFRADAPTNIAPVVAAVEHTVESAVRTAVFTTHITAFCTAVRPAFLSAF